ncbi:asparagine synthase (glutamine-hydrolyzing) [Pelagibacteraceae bacterium]|nr:asparagine synthase (glutamine-hydrolyzing) [Pelagibacteraceae bacterium]
MCGILGIINHNLNIEDLNSITDKLIKLLNHRGPDGNGKWINKKNTVSLGHSRLSIQDLSNNGSQPMICQSGNKIISFNGEIYNNLELRKKIEQVKNIKWRSTSDTETLIECLDIFGLEKTLNDIRGMFSIILYDIQNNKIYLARDRFGEKPLYYGKIKNSIVFGSELKVFQNFPEFNNSINKVALDKLFRNLFIPSPLSIYNNIFKIEIGSFIEIDIENSKNLELKLIKQKKWWKYENTINSKSQDRYQNFSEAHKALKNTLFEAIDLQQISDVPYGVFLSSGIDSSLVASIMQNINSKKIDTFTIGFNENEFNEANDAKKIANYIGSNHHEQYIDSKQALNLIPNISKIYDEPFADSSQIPTYFVSKLARENVTVALSGDGGDELFAGYNRYLWTPKIIARLNSIPYFVRKIVANTLIFLQKNNIKINNDIIEKIIKISQFNEKVNKTAIRLKNYKNLNDLLLNPVSEWEKDTKIVSNLKDYHNSNIQIPTSLENIVEKMMFIDSQTYLPDDILCKVDRASMYNSLEVRCPFLDREVINISHKIPTKMKLKNNSGKIILKEILKEFIPENLTDRSKKGFAIPLGKWLKKPLRGWAEDLLTDTKLKEQDFINHKIVKNLWNNHTNNNIDNSSKLWPILMFQNWITNN